MKRKIKPIHIDKLVVDGSNVRDEQWDADEEFITDVKTNEIMNPLLVRPLKSGKFGIVCGSRRYNAAIDAGLVEIPCVIQEMDDLTALGRSIAENKYIKSVETWMYQKKIGQMYEILKGKLLHGAAVSKGGRGKEGIILKISKLTGMSKDSIQRYVTISEDLTEETKELLKEPEQRSPEVKAKIQRTSPTENIPRMNISTAVEIARKVKEPERQFETATVISSMSEDKTKKDKVREVETKREKAKEFVRRVVATPSRSPKEVYVETKKHEENNLPLWVSFEPRIKKLLEQVAVKQRMRVKPLVHRYVKEGLRRDGMSA